MSPEPAPRYALYYAPEPDDPLWSAGCRWLGRDPVSGLELMTPGYERRADRVAAARRYGFHATIKAPMMLAGTQASFLAAVGTLAAGLAPVALPPLRIVDEDGFSAIRPVEMTDALLALGAACVAGLDPHRRPEAPDVVARRAVRRTARQKTLLLRWGYPHVFEEWRFHMTLADRALSPDLREDAEACFAPHLRERRFVKSLCVFEEQAAGTPFALLRRFPLRGGS